MVQCVPWWLTGIEPVHGSHAATCIENREKPQINESNRKKTSSLSSLVELSMFNFMHVNGCISRR